MSKVDVKFEDNKLKVGVDTNEDGQPVVMLQVHASEALQEAISKFKKGEEVEPVVVDAKAVTFKFEGGALKLLVDTDKDGEASIDLAVDMGEAIDEIAG